MKGYIYTMFQGADPAQGWRLTDPIFGKVPTLGACMPNIRRVVTPGDHIFVISGRVTGVKQYVVGGFEVAEKIDALDAYARFPDNRQREMSDGELAGNIIVDKDGNRTSVDYHSNFAKRIDNYVVGRKPLVLEKPAHVQRGRDETLEALGDLFSVKAKRLSEITGRWRKLDETQIDKLQAWLRSIKRDN